MKINKIQKIKNLNLFNWNTSLKEWNLKNLEWFLINDTNNYKNNVTYYFNEYWKVNTNNIIDEFIKKNKRKWRFIYDILKKWDISLNFSWHLTCASWLWYTLDKISFISLWYRKKIKMFEIKTNDNNKIILTKDIEILTNSWYKKVHLLKKWDMIIWLLWNSFNWFKKWAYKKKFIDIYTILNNIKKDIEKKWKNFISIKDINKKYLPYLNIIWINSLKKNIYLNDINVLINNINKDDIDYNEKNILSNNFSWSKKNFFLREIISIKEVEINDWYIGSIVSKLSNNYIINNIIIKK